MVIVFLILSVLLFCLFKMVPGDPARMMVEGQKMSVSPEKYEMLYQEARARLGLDKPLVIQYFSWFGNMLRGDFGYSSVYRIPVLDLVGPPMRNTVCLNLVYYVLDGDVVLRDGETLGFTADQKLPITRGQGVSLDGITLKIGYPG